ncbi:MAG: YkvA family protein [Haliscomenobacter sp.]
MKKWNLQKLDKYRRFFSERDFWAKLGRYARRIGLKAVYTALLMFYAYQRKETPFWAKNIILGVLGYLLAPLDFLPDLAPIIGFTDDIGILTVGLVTIASYVNDDVRTKARTKIGQWFPDYNKEEIIEIESKLSKENSTEGRSDSHRNQP